jgi:hypothetical protein
MTHSDGSDIDVIRLISEPNSNLIEVRIQRAGAGTGEEESLGRFSVHEENPLPGAWSYQAVRLPARILVVRP